MAKSIARVIVFERGSVLVFAEGGAHDAMNVPGGHVERGEGIAEAAARELLEETGLVARGLVPVYETKGASGARCVFFVATDWGGRLLRRSDEGTPSWGSLSDLVDVERAPHAATNREALRAAILRATPRQSGAQATHEHRFRERDARRVGDALMLDWSSERFGPSDLARGMNHELEHCDVTGCDPLQTARIALAHLWERPDYYDVLEEKIG